VSCGGTTHSGIIASRRQTRFVHLEYSIPLVATQSSINVFLFKDLQIGVVVLFVDLEALPSVIVAACRQTNVFFSGCPNQEIGQTFLFKGHKIGTSSYLGADSATKKTLQCCQVSSLNSSKISPGPCDLA
jgi:hypothetical protein